MFIFVGPGCVEEAVREKEGRQNPACLQVKSPQIQRDSWLCASVCSCVYLSERQRRLQYSNTNTSYGLTYTDTHRHTHAHTYTKHLIAKVKSKKKSISRAPLCLMCSTLILPFGDICCCVNYTPPGALINTHTNTYTHQDTETQRVHNVVARRRVD